MRDSRCAVLWRRDSKQLILELTIVSQCAERQMGMVGVLQWRQRRRWRHLLLLAVPRQLRQPEVLLLSPPLPSLSPHPCAIVIRRL